MREQERAPRKYELMTILHPEVADESLPAELDRIQAYITTIGGELIESLRDSPWGRRRLAYPIRSGGKDVRDGYYTVWHFNLAPNLITELERELKLNTQVIRYLVVTWEPKPLTPKEIEAAEIAAEDAAAAAYAAAQVEAAAAAQQAGGAAETAAAEAPAEGAEGQAEPASVAQPSDTAQAAPQGEGAEPVTGTAAPRSDAEALTREAEAVEASGADVALETLDTAGAGDAIEPVSAIEARSELEGAAAIAVARSQTEASGETAPAEGSAGAANPAETTAEVPEGAVAGSGTNECPSDYPVKGNANSRLYHTPGSPSYERTIPEFCFASVEAAEAAGFGPTKYEAAQAESE